MGASSWLRSWVERMRPRTLIELGAHKGEDTAWMAAIPGCTVHAVEADPRNVPPADLLARSNVCWASAAIADRDGELAELLMRRHIRASRRNVERRLTT